MVGCQKFLSTYLWSKVDSCFCESVYITKISGHTAKFFSQTVFFNPEKGLTSKGRQNDICSVIIKVKLLKLLIFGIYEEKI